MSAVLQDRPEPGTVDLTRSLPGQEALLTPAAQTFLAGLHVRFEGERQARLAARRARQACFDAGALPDFRDDTASIRASDWRVAPMHEKCDAAPTPSDRIARTVPNVPSCVEPPAP